MVNTQNQAQSIFLNALEIGSQSERDAYVESECKGVEELQNEVEELIGHAQKLGQFMDDGDVADTTVQTGIQTVSELPGAMIGPYQISEQLGEGGMGVVYVADQTEPVRRRVALKVIKPGMDSKEITGRFQAERQTLAMMSHPNIAKVLDGGTTENGRPYFVMELVNGTPITKFCDQQKLRIRERLELFITVCQAVQHAHMKGIIHRDLKPSNVLVEQDDGTAVPKVIDFGIAKATRQQLSHHSVHTQISQLVGTPIYMSPEQAQISGIDIDTRSDVYSLGVTLYELLTGVTPFDQEVFSSVSVDEMRRMIREDEPPRPSIRVRTLSDHAKSTISESHQTLPNEMSISMQRELDWIVMKSLEKDRIRRYESANALAADLQRYLDDEPVKACPPTLNYRFTKYARRNKVWLTTTAIVVASLLTATAVSIWKTVAAEDARVAAVSSNKLADERLVFAEEQRKFAEDNLRQAQEAVDQYFTLVSESTLLDEPGLQPLRLELIEGAITFYEQFASRNSENPDLQLELAATHLRLAQIYHALFRYEDRTFALENGFTLVSNLVQRQPVQSEVYLALADFWHGGRALIGQDLQPVTDHSHALEIFQQGIELWEQFVEAHPATPGFQSDLSKFYDVVNHSQIALGERGAARQSMNRVVEIREKLVQEYPDVPEYRAELAFGYWHLASFIKSNELQQAEELYRQAITILDGAEFMLYRTDLAVIHFDFATFLRSQNRAVEALAECRKSMTLYEQVIDDYPHIAFYKDLLTKSRRLLGALLKSTGRTEEANSLLLGSVATSPSTAEEFVQRAKIYKQIRSFDKAIIDYENALEIAPDDILVQSEYVETLKSNVSPKKSISKLSELIEKHPASSIYYRLRGVVLQNQERYRDSLKDFDRSMEFITDENAPQSYVSRGHLFVLTKQRDKAIADFNKAFTYTGKISETSDSVNSVSRRLSKGGKFEDALYVAQIVSENYPNQYLTDLAFCEAYLGLKRHEKALAHINAAIAVHPEVWHLYKRRGVSFFRLNRYDEALAAFHTSLDLRSYDPSVFWWISPGDIADCPNIEFQEGMKSLANRAVKHSKQSAEALAARAALFLALGEREQAEEDLDAVLAADDAGYYPLFQAALLSATTGNSARYSELCLKMLSVFANSDVARDTYFTAWTCSLAPAALEDYTPAIKLADHAYQNGSGNQQYLESLGSILMRSGQYVEAKEALENALSAAISTNNTTSHIQYFLAITHQHSGNFTSAEAILKVANEAAFKELTDSPNWYRKLTLELLRKETEALIEIGIGGRSNDN